MIQYNVTVSKQAENDLDEIYRYIAFDLVSPIAANNLLSCFEKSFSELSCFPERNRLCDIAKYKNDNYRIMPVNNYLIIYSVDNSSYEVTILRVLYGSRNLYDNLS